MALVGDGPKRQPGDALDHREDGEHRQNVEARWIRSVLLFDIRARWRRRGLYGAISWWLFRYYGRFDRPFFVHDRLAASEALIDPQVKPHPLCGRSLSSETLGGVGTQ